MMPWDGVVYEADPEFEAHVLTQLQKSGRPLTSWGHLHFVPGPAVPSYWHRNLWLSPFQGTAESVSQVARDLRGLGALWSPRPQDRHRRHALIQEKLPRLTPKPREFPFLAPPGPIGAWALGPDETLWASPHTASPFPGGDPLLVENKTDPPSSAYRKLQEALVLSRSWPGPGSVCLDAGSCPGGWTWVLAQLGATVHSIDRAPIDERLQALPNVSFRIGNAFSLHPGDFGPLDWLCSDVICYPQKLWTWVESWLAAGTVKNFVITVKMQGNEIDWPTLDRFASVPQSRLVHLNHNKHEVTWLYSSALTNQSELGPTTPTRR